MLSDRTLQDALDKALDGLDLEALDPAGAAALGPRRRGLVRDSWVAGRHRLLVTTDRLSAYDQVVGLVPFKGQLLNQLSVWWFLETQDIVANHVVRVPDPNVLVAWNARVLPVEVVVRGYITGVTPTALWTRYAAGEERPYGLALPRGLAKNVALPQPVITPTTRAPRGEPDECLSGAEVVARELVEAAMWRRIEEVSFALYARGQRRAREAGMLLVDTKYEFGVIEHEDGREELVLIDELHTPDSSRYWIAESYAERVASGLEPESFDKEYVRLWFHAQGYDGTGPAPRLADHVAVELAARYIDLYEQITGQPFEPAPLPAAPRIADCLRALRASGALA